MSMTKIEVQGVIGHMDHEHDKDRSARRKWSHGP